MERPAYLSPANRGAVFPDADVGVHTGTVVFKQRLRHERDGLAMTFGDVLEDVFEPHELVGHLDQGSEPHVDFGLTRGGDLMMLSLNGDAQAFQVMTISVRMSCWESVGDTGK